MEEREKLRREVADKLNSGIHTAVVIEKLLAKLEKKVGQGGSSCKAPGTGLWDPYMTLTRYYVGWGDRFPNNDKVIWGAKKTLAMLGFEIKDGESGEFSIVVEKWGVMIGYVLECFLLLWTAFARAGNQRGAEGARDLATIAYKIIVGEDETFDKTYGDKARILIGQRQLWMRQRQ